MQWTPSKDFITKLQLAPKPPKVIPAVPYPEKQGEYKGSRWYSTAVDPLVINDFIVNYLTFLSQCKEYTIMGRKDNEIKALAKSIIKEYTTNHDKAEAIHNWIYRNIEYERTSLIIPPWDLIKSKGGDCKSFSVLAASLLGVVDIPCWFKLIKISREDLLHLYDMAKISWGAIDSVGKYPFVEVKQVLGYIIFEIDKTSDFPPKPLPSGSTIIFPDTEKIKKTLPLLILGIGAVSIPIALLFRKGEKERKKYRPYEEKPKLP